jgi:hypothetical protein
MPSFPPAQRPLLILGSVAVILDLVLGLVVGLMPSHWEEASTSAQAVFVVLAVVGSLVLALGLWEFQRSPWLGVALISVGAICGALPLFWTIVPVLLAVALIVLSVIYARRSTAVMHPKTQT